MNASNHVAHLKHKVFHWYRLCLRSGRTWPGPLEEKSYILSEAKKSFRENRGITDPAEIERKISECQARYELAWHYNIPYPRLHHSKQSKYREVPIIPGRT
mmetsp:Transcript_36555/g.81385  ORF Transcript_36555/g.81385 Transcript_36555/m.81385 type:complete len:101 (-) Transcript_36555:3775-4077(-)